MRPSSGIRAGLRMALNTLAMLMAVLGSKGDGIRIDWSQNRLSVLSSELPGGKVEIWYLEAFCRKGSTKRKWEETVIPQQTVRLDGSGPADHIRLKTMLEGGVSV